MPGTNSFYPYGESSTNILNNSEYQTDSERSSGAQSGAIARSKMYNKQARQAAAGAYAVGALVAKSGKNADDSSAATLAANFQAAVNYQAAHFVASAVSVSGTTATATVAELATTAAADLPALFALSLVLDQALPAEASIAIASSLPDVTLSWPIYVGSEALDSDTITGGAITLLIDTVGAKAFFKAGGGSKIPNDLPPLLPNFALDFSGTTVTVTANKLPLSDKTSMLAGGVWVLASTVPDSPKGTIVQQWTAADLIDSTQDTESTEVVTWTYPNWSAGEPIYCRQYTYNEKGQYQTMLQGAVASTEDEPIPSYSEVLSENTWAQIAEAVANNDPIVDSWQIGDTKDEVVAGETLTFVIVGKDHDDKSDGTGKAKLTFGMTQLMSNTRQMNGSNTNAGSFAGSALYAHLRDTILPGMPEELRAAIKPVNKPTSSGSQNSTIRNDSMSLWLFSEVEIFGRTTYSFGGEGFQYPYFATAANRIKRLFNGMGEVSIWWERSPYSDDSRRFCCVPTSGTAYYHYASTLYGVCFGFCI